MRNLILVIVIFFVSLVVFIWAIFYTPIPDSVVDVDNRNPELENNVPKEDLSRFFVDEIKTEEKPVLEIGDEDKCILFGEISSAGTVSSNTVCLPD